MIAKYRGHEIRVKREECLGGWDMLYFSIVRESDGYFCEDSFEESDEYVRDKIARLKKLIDAELLEGDPWEERASREHLESLGVTVI